MNQPPLPTTPPARQGQLIEDISGQSARMDDLAR